VGFVVGLEGMHHFAIQLMSGNGVTFIPCALVTFFCAAQLMCAAPLPPTRQASLTICSDCGRSLLP
jgi:hypothetical protein